MTDFIGSLPLGWRLVRLGEVFAERRESGRPALELLAITLERGVIRRDDLDLKDNSSVDKTAYKRITPGDLGYNTMRMWQGICGVSELEGIVSPAYTICVPRPAIDVYYAYYLFKYPPMVHVLRRYSQGLVDDTLSLKFPIFAQIKVPLPPLDEQGKVVEVLRTRDREIELAKRQVELLGTQKRGLMQKLLTGQIRVKV